MGLEIMAPELSSSSALQLVTSSNQRKIAQESSKWQTHHKSAEALKPQTKRGRQLVSLLRQPYLISTSKLDKLKQSSFKTANKQLTGTTRCTIISARRELVGYLTLASVLITLVPMLCGLELALASRDQESSLVGEIDVGKLQQPQTSDTKAALEAELNSIIQRQDLGSDAGNKILSAAIISRLMLGNLSDIGALEPTGSGELEAVSLDSTNQPDNANEASDSFVSTVADSQRLRKMLNYLNYELAQATGGLNGGQVFEQYPILPASQAATIKRASLKMGNYLRQQPGHLGGQRQLTGYGRVNSFDFGLGKRPDMSASGNILRYGESGAHLAAVSNSGLGKRPAHRYDFGLGKRVANPAYPRYDFGLGKRAPNRVRYDFGLGKTDNSN